MNRNPDRELAEKLEERLESLRVELRNSEEQRKELDEQIHVLSREVGYINGLLEIHRGASNAVDPAPTQTPVPTRQPLSPAELADAVVELIQEEGKPLHYRKIAEILEDKGLYEPRGKDPANTLLARYYNDSRLYRPQRGYYEIRPEAE